MFTLLYFKPLVRLRLVRRREQGFKMMEISAIVQPVLYCISLHIPHSLKSVYEHKTAQRDLPFIVRGCCTSDLFTQSS